MAMLKKKPNAFTTWSPKRQKQWKKNKLKFNQLNKQIDKARLAGDRDRIERLRGNLNAVKLRENQQLDTYKDQTTLTKAEQKQLDLQQQYMTLLGQANSTQVEQFKTQQSYLQSQINTQQKQIQEQNSLYNRILEQQEEATRIETMRAEREAGLLAYQNSQANLFNVQQERNAAQRQVSQQGRRTRNVYNRGVFSL